MAESAFNFLQHWYPIAPLEDLDPKRPTPVTILGHRLVVWKPTNSEQYRVFLDQCPHRLAPLSEGRVDQETGNLTCSYHGWQFNPEGECTNIPQAENPDLIAKNKQNFCVVTLPIQQVNDLLWVWLDEKSADLAAATPLPLSPSIDASKGFVWSSMVRDLEYDWQTLVENVADPSHVPFAHHGVQGNRKQAQPIPLEITQSTPDLIETVINKGFKTRITFEPPCRLEYAMEFPGDKKIGLVVYCVPVAPGKSRIVGQFPRNFAKTLHNIIPRWWDHIQNRNLVLDGDMVLLHYQEHRLQESQSTQSWKTAYKMPTSADRLVIEFRHWFDKYCQGKLPWEQTVVKALEQPLVNREVLLDRYKQHTMICESCSGALKNVQRSQIALIGYFAVSVATVAAMPDNLRVSIGLPLIALALVGLGGYAWLKFWLEPKFYFVDYVHSDK